MSSELQEKASISNQDEDMRQENENEQQVLKRLATLGDLLKDMLPERNVSEGMYQGMRWEGGGFFIVENKKSCLY